MDTNNIVIEQVYPAATAKVWEALTNKKALREWYFPVSAFEPVKGFRFQFPGDNGKGTTYNHLCEIVEVEPMQKLSYSWQYEGLPGYTLLTFQLFEQTDGTLLRLTHTGLESLAAAGPDFTRDNFIGGWTYFIHTALANYLKKEA